MSGKMLSDVMELEQKELINEFRVDLKKRINRFGSLINLNDSLIDLDRKWEKRLEK